MIDLLNVNKSYGGRNILSNVSLNIFENEFICITGESGVGKTTLLNIIGLLDVPDSGQVSICDKTLFSKSDILKLKRYFFGYIFQDYLLMKDETVEKNINVSIKYNENITHTKKEEVIKRVGLDNTFLQQKVYNLSGGEQQKVALARIMLKPYELLLADEPTGNLDSRNKKEIIEIFKSIKEMGKTIICVTHDKEITESADRIINLPIQ